MHATTIANPRGKTPGSGWILVLAGLLAVQIALALYLVLRGTGVGSTERDAPLLTFAPGQVQRIRIEHRGSEPIVLERTDKGWQIQSLAGFPAAKGRVDTLLERLNGLKRGLPVATSPESLARLKVADSDHEGRLTLEAGGKELAVLYLGDSAGVRRQYVRAADDGAVYEAGLSPADIPAKADDWADRALLTLDEGDIQRIELPGLSLEKADGGWQLADRKEGETLDQAKAADLARRLGSLSFVSVLGTEDKPEYGQDAPAREWRIGLASGDTLSYRLSRLKTAPAQTPALGSAESPAEPKPTGPDWYVLKVSHQPYYLKVASYTAEALLGTQRDGLLVKPQAAAAAAGTESGSAERAATTPPASPPAQPAETPPAAPAPGGQ